MTNEEFVNIIEEYQNNNYVHPLTCMCGYSMEGVEYKNEVILECGECGWSQKIQEPTKQIILSMYRAKGTK